MAHGLVSTGVSFPDATTLTSGNIPTANLGSGTANSTTFLRGDKTWQTISVTPTTAQVLSATAGASAGDVGTYVWARATAAPTDDVAFGGTKAGSQLQPTSAPYYIYTSYGISNFYSNSGSALSGTWRAMGTFDYQSGTGYGATLWLRIS